MSPSSILVILIFVVIAIVGVIGYTLFQMYMQEQRSGKNWVSGYTRDASVVEDEYSKLLSFFKLTDAASEEEIKAAYRKYVRDNHPDLNNADAEKIRKFQEVKTIYERILDMKRNSFGGHKQVM